ncbi:MAG: hypothetical protein JWL84_361 [Rhodospirillales bacterium]|nr:hypothetical protein [Rhodospirillales bacterium]
MAIDRGFLGYALPPFTVAASLERVTRFARAIGMTGEPVTVAPPTFMKAVEGEGNSSRRMLQAMGVELSRVLHVEQQFDYLAPIRVGDILLVDRAVTDIYDKRGGTMEFIVIESSISRDDGTPVGRSRQVILVRNPTAVPA